MLDIVGKKKKRIKRVRFHLLKNSSAHAARLIFIKSNRYLYLQVVKGATSIMSIATSSKYFKNLKNKNNIYSAIMLGSMMAELLKIKDSNNIFFFDRGRRRYHGKTKACANNMRSNGLNF